ncbi:MAG: hypothetical protein ACRDMH_00885 [Solirubrobacterales bacterium]
MKGRIQRGREWRSSLASVVRLAFAPLLLAALLVPGLAQAAKPGALDRSFGGDGKVTTNFGHYNTALAAAIDRHGRIVAVGSDFDLARYRRNGELDRTFSDDGKVTGGYDDALAVAIDSQGRLVVAGSSEECNFSSTYSSFVLARYRPNGSPDPSFDPATTYFTGYPCASANSVAIDSHGRIVVAGGVGGRVEPDCCDFALARYKPNGSLDPSFGGDGQVTTDFHGGGDQANGVAIDSHGRIVAAGGAGGSTPTNGGEALARYRPNGTLDPTFGGDGKVTTASGRRSIAQSVTIDPQARIVVAGLANWRGNGQGDFGLARYQSNGTLDPTFGDEGIVTTTFGRDHFDAAASVAIDSRGRLVAAGETRRHHPASDDNFAVSRYRPGGSLDRSFSGNGKVKTTFGGDDVAEAVALDSKDRIVAVGGGGRKGDFALARYIGYRKHR